MSRYPPLGMLGPRAIAWWALRTQTDDVQVRGLERVPRGGPVLIVARHYHHLLDGAVLVRYLGRPVHIVVGLDWAADARTRAVMERVCALAGWPVILRPRTTGERAGYRRDEVARYLRRGLRQAAELLRDGRVVAMFPEGYPAIDPAGWSDPPARDAHGFLPFARGVETVIRLARRAGAAPTIVPLGFRYERDDGRWRIAARFGAPADLAAPAATLERAVRGLSAERALAATSEVLLGEHDD